MSSHNKLAWDWPGNWTDTPRRRSCFTRAEEIFLRLHANFGPVMQRTLAETLCPAGVSPPTSFTAPGRHGLRLVATKALARVLSHMPDLPPFPPSPEPAGVTADDRTDGPATWLDMRLSPYVARSRSTGQLGHDQLEARYGPLLDSDTAAHLLYFGDSAALLRSIHRKAIVLQILRQEGRKPAFFSTREIAWFRAWMARHAADVDAGQHGAKRH